MHNEAHTPTELAMEACIKACCHCHQVCLYTALNHCLELGGEHVKPNHFRLMFNCAEICQTSANFMISGSAFHHRVCEVCSEICQACAEDCEKLGDMEDCVEACRACAESCQKMAKAVH